VCTYVCICLRVNACDHSNYVGVRHIYIYIYMCVCVCVCVCGLGVLLLKICLNLKTSTRIIDKSFVN